MRVDGLLEQAAVAARVDEPGEQFRVVAVLSRLPQEADHRARRSAHVGFEVRVVLVRDREARVERDGAIERLLRLRLDRTSRR